ncbi:MAG: NAD(P)/FAD-dependent oxidoreductase [Pseudomonadales bacterium]|nr:NAD(P)/FAD-dependent oxidoreductase [Pseudomonadales bacterium]
MEHVDAVVIGAGVVGLAIAARLSRHLSNVLVIDKNASFGEETSSRNSEVIHAGIYYPKDSLKAEFCVAGKQALYEYCQQRHIPCNNIGKLIVAQNTEEETYLQATIEKAAANGVDDLDWVSAKKLRAMEPNLSASAALLSPSTGIVDVHSYMQSLLTEIEQNNGKFVARTELERVECSDGDFVVTLNCEDEQLKLSSKYVINSAGLYCEQVAKRIEGLPEKFIPTLYWCRGHYFTYTGKSPFQQLIYPVPEENNVGLGIHGTLDLGGQLKFGPDTQYIDVLGYALDYAVSQDLRDTFVQAIKRYFPNIDAKKLQPAYSGIRPKLQAPGAVAEDFCVQGQDVHGVQGLVNLYGIESPGLTSSLAIAQRVVQQLGIEVSV